MNSIEKTKSKSNKGILYLLALGAFGINTTEFGVIGILPQLADTFKVSITDAGWLLTVFALTVALLGPFITLLIGNIDRKKTLSIALIIFVVSNIVSVYAPSFSVLIIARIIAAIFHPVFFSIAMSTAAQSVKPSDAPKAVAIVFSGISIGAVLGVPISAFFADIFGWQAAFILCAAVNFIAFISLSLLLPPMPVEEKSSMGNQLSILKDGSVWWNFILVAIFTAGAAVSYGYMAEYFKETVHMNGQDISIAMFLFGLAGVFGNIFMGRMLSKNVVRSTWVFFISMMIIQAVLYMNNNFYGAFPVIIIWGFIMTGVYVLGQTLITKAASKAPAFANSLYGSSGNMGFALGPFVGGIAIQIAGVGSLPLVSIAILLLASALFLLQTSSRRK